MVTITTYKPLTLKESRLGRSYLVERAYKNSPTYSLTLFLNRTGNTLGALWREEQAVLAGERWVRDGVIPNYNGDYVELFLWGRMNSCGSCVSRIDIGQLWDGIRDLWRRY
jgi:hypothetical protein